jgi:hypothetical protein
MVLIDLILNRPQAYRHILFNRSHGSKGYFLPREVLKFLTVIYAFDSFDRWYLNSDQVPLPTTESVVASPVGVFTQWLLPHEHQWLILLTAVGETTIYMFCMYWGVRIYLHSKWGHHRFNFSSLFSAIVLSCFSKLGVLLWMVWDARSHHRFGIELFTLMSNVVAITVFIGDGTTPDRRTNFPAMVIVGIAFFAKVIFAYLMTRYEPAIHFSLF